MPQWNDRRRWQFLVPQSSHCGTIKLNRSPQIYHDPLNDERFFPGWCPRIQTFYLSSNLIAHCGVVAMAILIGVVSFSKQLIHILAQNIRYTAYQRSFCFDRKIVLKEGLSVFMRIPFSGLWWLHFSFSITHRCHKIEFYVEYSGNSSAIWSERVWWNDHIDQVRFAFWRRICFIV
jgi:hypothetical protein